jgi:hypothetical protein
MNTFLKKIKIFSGILIVVAILSPSSQMSAWADVVAQSGYSVTLLNNELAGPVELAFDQAGIVSPIMIYT